MKIPNTENPAIIRTDFTNDINWKKICDQIKNPDQEFLANIDFIDKSKWKDFGIDKILKSLPEDYDHPILFLVDNISISEVDHPILCVDLEEEEGRFFRVIPSELWSVENNLSIGNMEFEEFLNAVDSKGVFRGF